jgi:hypothetical protein
MHRAIADGTERVIDGRLRVYYDGYWIKSYPIPKDTLLEKRRLIEVLTRRLFNHVEHGLYVPGFRLEEARQAYESEVDLARKRVKGGMLAAALFNRATDILTKLVELQALGVEIKTSGPLMRTCGEHLQEALDLGKLVLHRSGEEGVDELWGEPFKAFAFPVEEFYKSRYVKVAMTMHCIDRVVEKLTETFRDLSAFAGVDALLATLGSTAKLYSETLRADADIFDVWTSFAVATERVTLFPALTPSDASHAVRQAIEQGLRVLREGGEVIASIARVRVPMPKATESLIRRCEEYQECWAAELKPKRRRSEPAHA